MKIHSFTQLLRKPFLYFQTLTEALVPSFSELRLMRICRQWPQISNPQATSVVLVQAFWQMGYVVRCFYFLKFLIQKNQRKPTRLIFLESDAPRPLAKGLWARKIRGIRQTRLFNWKTRAYYNPLGGEWGFSFRVDSAELVDLQTAKTLFENLKSKEDLEKLTIDGVEVGDLIYDTYLRYRPAPTVDIKDVYVEELILWTVVMIKRMKAFLKETPVETLVTSYTSYLSHGLIVRICLQQKIQVYALFVLNAMAVSVSSALPYHLRNFHLYKRRAATVAERDEIIDQGNKALELRFSGKNDPMTFYMTKSGFAPGDQYPWPEKKAPRVIIMGHDFFDSPHIFGPKLFPDFVEWLNFIFEHAKNSPFEFFFKPHPNALPESSLVVESFKRLNPHIHFLPKTVSNLDIVQQNFDLMLTVHGSVAHEFPYLGLPVLSCGANEHSSFSFSLQATSRQDLADWIQNFPIRLKNLKFDKSEMAWFLGEYNLISPVKSKDLDFQNVDTSEACRLLSHRGSHLMNDFMHAFQASLDRESHQFQLERMADGSPQR